MRIITMSDKKVVLIVDDSPEDIQVIMQNLKDTYAVLVANSGTKALEMAQKENKPDVILLDIMMPGIDGYETCRQLKQNDVTRDIDVIFVSANDTVEEKMAGYDVGASDYVIKPVHPEELRQKVDLAIDNQSVRNQIGELMATTMNVITSSGEQGVIIDFFRESGVTTSIDKLGKLIVEAVGHYNLKNTVQIRSEQGTFFYGTKMPVPPLEQELLTRQKDGDKIFSWGSRCIYNFNNISLLVKNMPEEQEMKGRIRDNLAILVEGAGARLQVLDKDSVLSNLVHDSNEVIKQVEDEQLEHKLESKHVLEDLLDEIEEAFLAWGLTEQQEQVLVNIVRNSIDRSMNLFDRGIETDKKMSKVFDRLSELS